MIFLSDMLDESKLRATPWASAPSTNSPRCFLTRSHLFPQPLLSGCFVSVRSPSKKFALQSTLSHDNRLSTAMSQRFHSKSENGSSQVHALLSSHSRHRLSLNAEMDVPSIGTFTLSALECGQKAVGIPPNAKLGFRGVGSLLKGFTSSIEMAVDVVNGPCIEAGVVIGTPSLCVGVGGMYNAGNGFESSSSVSKKLEEWHCIFRYTSVDHSWTSTASIQDQGNVWRWNMKQSVSSYLDVASEVEYQRRRRSVIIQGQGQVKLSSRESVFGTLDSEAKLGVAYQYRVAPLVQVALSGRVNLLKLETDSHQLGISILLW